jgi:hypothetical protein
LIDTFELHSDYALNSLTKNNCCVERAILNIIHLGFVNRKLGNSVARRLEEACRRDYDR